jgi:hypothetical protein
VVKEGEGEKVRRKTEESFIGRKEEGREVRKKEGHEGR